MLRAKFWQCRDRVIDLTEPVIMGIVNVTPDSFSDGGLHATHEKAVAFARKLAEDGAEILDVGGESTRPGAAPVSFEEEADRALPVVETLVKEGYTVSVDTYKPQMMREALALGAHIINDVKALTEEGALETVAESGAGIVLMHFDAVREGHLFEDIEGFLKERANLAMKAGIPRETLSLDPGFGFGKTMEENLELLEKFETFDVGQFPILIGVSRKRMIGKITGMADPRERVEGSVAAAVKLAGKGAAILRVHDAKETRQALQRAGCLRKCQ